MLISNCDSKKAIKKFTNNVKKLSRRINYLKLNINVDKTKIMIVGNKPEIKLKISGNLIEIVKSIKYLGVWFDYNNRYSTNTSEIISRTNRRAGALRFIFNRITGSKTEIVLKIYKSLLRPLLEYAKYMENGIYRKMQKIGKLTA